MHASLYDWIVYKREFKARERKGEEGERRSKIYMIFDHMTATVQDLSDTVRRSKERSKGRSKGAA